MTDSNAGAGDSRGTVGPRIDAHHHVWDLDVRSQGWTANFPCIDRTFTMADLEPLLGPAGVAGTVLVETINVAGETAELLATAAENPVVRGVVGWVDLTARDLSDRIHALRTLPGGERLVGLRHQVQSEADPNWLTRPDVLAGLVTVAHSGLSFDLLVTPAQLPAAIEAVRATPSGRFVLAHLGKPPVATTELEPWAANVRRLAASGQVACKLSGLVTEARPDWSIDELRPYASHVIEVFGPQRLMAGSDWPVCLLRTDYAGVWKATDNLLAGLSETERDSVLRATATNWYGL